MVLAMNILGMLLSVEEQTGNPYRNTSPKYLNLTEIVIPSSMSARWYDGVSLYPPSQLSMLGDLFNERSGTSDLIWKTPSGLGRHNANWAVISRNNATPDKKLKEME